MGVITNEHDVFKGDTLEDYDAWFARKYPDNYPVTNRGAFYSE